MKPQGLPERQALRFIGMSESSFRHQSAPDHNVELCKRIVTLVHRHRRYGAGMIYLKIREAGLHVNHKRVDRLYALEKLQIKRRRRKKVPVGDRQLLLRPEAANEVWSMDFVFDRVDGGRAIKSRGRCHSRSGGHRSSAPAGRADSRGAGLAVRPRKGKRTVRLNANFA